MASNQEIVRLLRLFALRKKNHILQFPEFSTFVARYVEQKAGENPALRAFAGDTNLKLVAGLEDLAETTHCSLTYHEGKIQSIVFPELFQHVVRKRYQEIEGDAEIPFPNEMSFDLEFPPDAVDPVDIRKDFVRLLSEKSAEASGILRLDFPEASVS